MKMVVTERSEQLMKAEASRCKHQNAAQRLCVFCAAKQLQRELRYTDNYRPDPPEVAELRAEVARLRAALEPAALALDECARTFLGTNSRGPDPELIASVIIQARTALRGEPK